MAAPLNDHLVVGGADPVQHPLEVDVDAAVPCLGCGCMVGEERERHDSGVVDHHVERPEDLHGPRHQRLDLTPIAHVDLHTDGTPGTRLDPLRDLLGGHPVDVGHDHRRAPLGGHLGDQPTEAATSAGHDDHPSVEVARCSLGLWRRVRDRGVVHRGSLALGRERPDHRPSAGQCVVAPSSEPAPRALVTAWLMATMSPPTTRPTTADMTVLANQPSGPPNPATSCSGASRWWTRS